MLSRKLAVVLKTTKPHLYRLENIGLETFEDLLLYFPRTYNDTTEYRKINEIDLTEVNTIKGKLTNLFNVRTKFGKKITRGVFTDETGSISVVWFNQPHIIRMIPQKTEIVLSGKIKISMGKPTFQSPSYEVLERSSESLHTGRIVPVYHETEGLTSKWLREKLKPIMDNWIDNFQEYMPEEIIKEHNLIDYKTAIKNVHFPENEESLAKAKERLAFDELFLLQLKVLQKRWYWQSVSEKESKVLESKIEHIKECIKSLPFSLTNAQKRVL